MRLKRFILCFKYSNLVLSNSTEFTVLNASENASVSPPTLAVPSVIDIFAPTFCLINFINCFVKCGLLIEYLPTSSIFILSLLLGKYSGS